MASPSGELSAKLTEGASSPLPALQVTSTKGGGKRPLRIFGLLAALCLLAGCAAPAAAPTRSPDELLEPVAVQVDTVTVTRQDLKHFYTSQETGYICEAPVVPHTQLLSFEAGGRVMQPEFYPGDRVEAGQCLASLDTTGTREEISALQTQIEQLNTLGGFDDRIAQANIAIAKEELAVLRENGALEQTCLVKEADIALLENALEQAQEKRALECGELERQIADLRSSLKDLELTAPFDGILVYVNPEILNGQRDTLRGGEALYAIADPTRLRIDTEQIAETVLERAERIYALIDGVEYDLVYAPYSPEERIQRFREGTLNTRFTFEEAPQALEYGGIAAIMILTDSRENVLALPINALYRDGMNYYVKKLENGQQVRCDVTVGLKTASMAEICSGLQEGDVVYVQE